MFDATKVSLCGVCGADAGDDGGIPRAYCIACVNTRYDAMMAHYKSGAPIQYRDATTDDLPPTPPPSAEELDAEYERMVNALVNPCERCQEREAYQSHDDGVCDHCHEVAADRAYDRMRDRD